MKGSPEMAKPQSWSALLSAVVTRLTPRALAFLLLVFLVLVFGLLAYGLATGRDVVVSWKELSAKYPPSERSSLRRPSRSGKCVFAIALASTMRSSSETLSNMLIGAP